MDASPPFNLNNCSVGTIAVFEKSAMDFFGVVFLIIGYLSEESLFFSPGLLKIFQGFHHDKSMPEF